MRTFTLIGCIIILTGFIHSYSQTKGQENAFVEESNLPIVVISPTDDIPNDERVEAHLGIIWNKGEIKNKLSDPYNEYDGDIMIERHGKSSLMFPKNSYRFETQDQYMQNMNTSILDMPAEDDWIIYAPYSDKSLMHNALAYTLAGEINDYAPRVRYCELIVDGEYKGIYVMTEKIEEDNDRVDVAELTDQYTTEPEITGGYVFRKDKFDPWDNRLHLDRSDLDLIINEPKVEDINNTQETWLKNHLDEFEDSLYTGGNYENYIDVESFVHNFLIVEFMKNIDGYRLSTYFHKDREEKIVAGPVWDYNLAFGNADYLEGWSPKGWYYPLPEPNSAMNDIFWFSELIREQDFFELSIKRWKKLRKDQLSLHHIYSLIDHWQKTLTEAQERNFDKYQVLGQHVWPNPGFSESASNAPQSGAPVTWKGEIEQLKNFIKNRLAWMDEQFGLKSTKVNLKVNKSPQGKIVHNNHIITDSAYTETFTKDSTLNLKAIPAPGYQFKHWDKRQVGNKTESIIEKGGKWKYYDKGESPGNNWIDASFDDSQWAKGTAQLGYGDDDEVTIVDYGSDADNKYVTTYFRHTFSLNNTGRYEDLKINLLRDDGAVVYLNGKEIIRSNMPQDEITYNTFASNYVSGNAESAFKTFTVDTENLKQGENILSVEIHQANSTSSDISFDLALSGTISTKNDTPVVIGTEKTCTDTLKNNNTLITAHFEKAATNTVTTPVINEFVAFNEGGVTDEYNEYDDWIELYNPTDHSVDIGGMFISDEPGNPGKVKIPADAPDKTTIAAGEYKILWADNDSTQGPLHFNFRLDKESESITLAKEENNQMHYLDIISFQKQNADVSKGRLPNGEAEWHFFANPTPGEPNAITVDIDETTAANKDGYTLHANYPNPFKNNTTIGYSIPKREKVKLTIYNNQGELIKTVVNQTRSPGYHSTKWHAADYPPGIYFYKLTAGNYSNVKKCVILK